MAWEQVLCIDFVMAQNSMREEIPQRGYKVTVVLSFCFNTYPFFLISKIFLTNKELFFFLFLLIFL